MIAIKNGRILTMAGPTLPQGTVIIEDGRIKAVGADLPVPDGAEVIDATGKVVMPGLIDAHCHVGIAEEIYRVEGDDTNEYSDPVTPHLRAIDAVNPEDLGFRDALAGGVTTVCTTPGSANILGGEMLAMKTAGRVIDEMVIQAPIGLKAALGENPKRVYGRDKKTPITRMASAALLRTALTGARDYLDKIERAGRGEGEKPGRDLKHEVVAKVLTGEIPLRLHAHRADDIMTALRIAREFGIRLVIEHATEGYKVADILAREDIPVIIGPIITNRPKVEMRDRTIKAAHHYREVGVRFAIMTDHPVVPIEYLGLSAALTVRGGLDEESAMQAVTIEAARILGLDERIGSLEPGKDADLIILDRDFFDVRARVERVYVAGECVYE
ncbi:MAG: amidohydrolase [Desulforudis sp.]|jgi:imidazolonepropionase-like amidohydrolase|nr:amidohydrolase [Clostridia bacterium]MDQ7791330.1 amidohydrolase [Clostridia bacterium]RJX20662.1 MAG: amidohydrolase [Desulforudis sp.]